MPGAIKAKTTLVGSNKLQVEKKGMHEMGYPPSSLETGIQSSPNKGRGRVHIFKGVENAEIGWGRNRRVLLQCTVNQALVLEAVQHPFNEIQQLLVSPTGASQQSAGHTPDSHQLSAARRVRNGEAVAGACKFYHFHLATTNPKSQNNAIVVLTKMPTHLSAQPA